MTEEILSYTHPFRTPRCRESVLSPGMPKLRIARGNAVGREGSTEGRESIINDRDGVSLALNFSGLHEENYDKRSAKGYPDGITLCV